MVVKQVGMFVLFFLFMLVFSGGHKDSSDPGAAEPMCRALPGAAFRVYTRTKER